MATLTIDHERATSLGQEIIDSSDTIKGYLDDIASINAEIETAWNGTDATAYCGRINEQLKEMTAIKDTIAETGVYMQKVADAYRKVSEENSTYTP